METHTVFKNVVLRASLLGFILALVTGCSNQITTFPTVTSAYAFSQLVTIPGVPPATGSWSDGFGYADKADGVYLLADRTTAGIDVVSMSSLQFLRTAGKGAFVGDRSSPPQSAGPNAVVPVGNGVAFGTDGNSDIVVVNVNSGAALATISIPNTGNPQNRVDLLDFDSKDSIVLAGNDVSTPSPVVTFVSTVAPYPVLGQIALTTSTGGVEQPTYDPTQGVFLLDVPSTTANPSGEVDVINPTTEQIVKVIPVGGNCGPTGSALGPNEELAVSCSNVPSASQIINAVTGASIATIPTANGCDQAWYNSGDNRFAFACSHEVTGGKNTPLVAIVDAASTQLVTTIPTAKSANAVSVDPATNHVFIPLRKGTGRIGVDVFTYQ